MRWQAGRVADRRRLGRCAAITSSKAEISACKAGIVERSLQAVGGLVHAIRNAFENLFSDQILLTNRLGQRQGKGRISALAIIGDIAGRRGIGNEQAARRLHLGQSAGSAARCAGQRIVATGIENDQIHRIAGMLNIAQCIPKTWRLSPYVLL